MPKYKDYINSPAWKIRRDFAIKSADGKCQLCNSGSEITVHHRTYERLGDELPQDLTVLCAACHKKFHDIPSDCKTLDQTHGANRDNAPSKRYIVVDFGLLSVERLSITDKLLYGLLVTLQGTKGKTFPTRSTLASMLCIAERSVFKAVKALEEVGLIRVSRARRKDGKLKNTYFVMPISNMKAQHPKG